MLVNIILIAIILLFCFFAIKSTINHIQGKGGCCGGGSAEEIIKPKHLSKVYAEKQIEISGMKCKNCAIRVQNSLNNLEGVNAKVNFKKAAASVKISDGISETSLKEAVEKAGYKVLSIK